MRRVYYWLNKEKFRYYTIIVHKDMLNDMVLTYSWGGCNSNRSGKKNIRVTSDEEAEKKISCMMKRRSKRGYQLIAPIYER
jgi:predicted DNA-binding WGR domain protein